MSSIIGILASFAVSHLGGHLTLGLLEQCGLVAARRRISIARRVLRVGKALRRACGDDPRAREDLQQWLARYDPQNESGLGDGILDGPAAAADQTQPTGTADDRPAEPTPKRTRRKSTRSA